MNGFRKPPVKQGDEMEVDVIGKGKKPNTAITKVDGYIVFIQECDLKQGDKIKVQITAALPRYGFAKVTKGSEDFESENIDLDEDKNPAL